MAEKKPHIMISAIIAAFLYPVFKRKWHPKVPFRLLGNKVVNPGDYAARAYTSSLAAFAVMVFA
jgi:hypothetical protein